MNMGLFFLKDGSIDSAQQYSSERVCHQYCNLSLGIISAVWNDVYAMPKLLKSKILLGCQAISQFKGTVWWIKGFYY